MSRTEPPYRPSRHKAAFILLLLALADAVVFFVIFQAPGSETLANDFSWGLLIKTGVLLLLNLFFILELARTASVVVDDAGVSGLRWHFSATRRPVRWEPFLLSWPDVQDARVSAAAFHLAGKHLKVVVSVLNYRKPDEVWAFVGERLAQHLRPGNVKP